MIAHTPAWRVFLIFLRLGLTSFGGPVAHLGYFREAFVTRLRWLDEHQYAEIVALCQILPGPASSQVGMVLGLGRAGPWGALAAWAGFTLPSALLLAALGIWLGVHPGLADAGWVHGLKIAAVAIVAQAIWGMARALCPDLPRAAMAAAAALLVSVLPTSVGQIAAIVAAGIIGARWLRAAPMAAHPPAIIQVRRDVGMLALGLFLILLGGLPLAAALSGSTTVAMIEGVYRAGSLVFGGGHVVLPLLQSSLVPLGVVDDGAFLAGYGAAQAVPGPLFTLAAYLGAVAHGPLSGWLGAAVLTFTIFVPAAILVLAGLAFWTPLRRHPGMRRALTGINAAVVGILVAAWFDPVLVTAIRGWQDATIAMAAFVLLMGTRTAPIIVVGLCALAGMALA